MAISIHHVSSTRDEQRFIRGLVLWKALRLPYRTKFRVFSGAAYVSSDQLRMLTSNTLTMPLQDALQELRDTGMVASSRLATLDDITRLLGLEQKRPRASLY
jgi:hypothetical protein